MSPLTMAMAVLALWAYAGSAVAEAAGAAPTVETKVVGSSTVAPFARLVRSRLGDAASSLTIEPTGTAGGMTLFCGSVDHYFAPIVLASRPVTPEELADCAANGRHHIEQHVIGLSGIVLASSSRRSVRHLSKEDIFLGLANRVPDDACVLQPNTARSWQDVSADLPRARIKVFGPPSSSGTRTSFVELAMREGALALPCLRKLAATDPASFEAVVSTIRTDGAWVDAGENDAVVLGAIEHIPDAMGVISFSLYTEFPDQLRAVAIDGAVPTKANIENRTYGLARALYVYADSNAVSQNEAATMFVEEITSNAAIGKGGYLIEMGLVGAE